VNPILDVVSGDLLIQTSIFILNLF